MEQTVTTARARRGQALISVTAFLVLSMLLWTAAYQHGACHLRVEKALKVRPERADQLRRAMAWGLALLETGKPSAGLEQTYACRMVVEGEEYVAIFTRIETDVYQLHVRPKAGPSDDSLPMAPEHF